jgi:hypothetical protein
VRSTATLWVGGVRAPQGADSSQPTAIRLDLAQAKPSPWFQTITLAPRASVSSGRRAKPRHPAARLDHLAQLAHHGAPPRLPSRCFAARSALPASDAVNAVTAAVPSPWRKSDRRAVRPRGALDGALTTTLRRSASSRRRGRRPSCRRIDARVITGLCDWRQGRAPCGGVRDRR